MHLTEEPYFFHTYFYISAAKLLIYRRIGIFIKYHKLFTFSLCRFL